MPKSKQPKKKIKNTKDKTYKMEKIKKTLPYLELVDDLYEDPLNKWYIKNFSDACFPKKQSDELKAHFSQNNKFFIKNSLYQRLNSMDKMVALLTFDIVDTICTTYKLRDIDKKDEVIFAFVYYKDDATEVPVGKGHVSGTNVIIDNISWGCSYLSKDGEYRNNIISMKNLDMLRFTEVAPLLGEIVEYLEYKIVRRNMMILREYFYPTEDKKHIEVQLEYYSYELQKKILAIVWFDMMYKLDNELVENHINKKFIDIFTRYKDEDLEFYKTLLKKYSSRICDMFLNYSRNIRSNLKNTKSHIRIGQKIIPLSIAEAQNPFNIRYKPWCEYLMSVRLSNLVVNCISPGFPLVNQWFYIKNSRKGLFDNDIQYEKMQRSELAVQITTLLNRAKLFSHENITKKKLIKIKQINTTWLSEKFKTLSSKIQDPIDFAKKEIIMSNVALCAVSEYVGYTIMDVLQLCNTSDFLNKEMDEPFSLSGFPHFNKLMFDMCYNLYCMNKIAGIIHGDLHLNNATIYNSYIRSTRDLTFEPDAQVLYIVGENENERYLFNQTMYNACIIDFSRGIILPDKIDELHDKSIPNSYNIVNKQKKFHDTQIERLVHLFIQNTSDNYSNKDELFFLFKKNFNGVFKLMTAVDIFGFTHKLLTIFEINDKSIITPHKKHIELLKNINTESRYFLTEQMNKLIQGIITEKDILDGNWPLYTIIKKVFYENSAQNQKLKKIIDIYNINIKSKHTLTKIDNFPVFLLEKHGLKNNKIVHVSEQISNSFKILKKNRKNYEKSTSKKFSVINYIAMRHKEKYG